MLFVRENNPPLSGKGGVHEMRDAGCGACGEAYQPAGDTCKTGHRDCNGQRSGI